MELWIFPAIAIIVLIFGILLLFGPPYVPTLAKQKIAALDLLELAEGDTFLELGCGDGRVLRAAAQRGYKVVGIELNPLLVIVSWLVTFRYRKQVRLIWGDIWDKPWPRADGIFAFLMPKYMPRLDETIEKWRHGEKPCKLVSNAFVIPDRRAAREREGVFLYLYE